MKLDRGSCKPTGGSDGNVLVESPVNLIGWIYRNRLLVSNGEWSPGSAFHEKCVERKGVENVRLGGRASSVTYGGDRSSICNRPMRVTDVNFY